MKLFLAMVLPASLLSTSSMAQPSAEASAPRPGTTEAMQCLAGQGPRGCGDVFQGGARVSAKDWVFHDPRRDFKRGALVSAKFRRRATDTNGCDAQVLTNKPTKEMDIFDVKFAYVGYTFYIAPADANGKIDALSISLWPHDNQLCDR